MKLKLKLLCRGLLLMMAALTLANCAAPGGSAYAPAPVVMTEPPPPAAEADEPAVARGSRYSNDPVSNARIDSLLAPENRTPSPALTHSKSRSGLATQAGQEQWDQLTTSPFYRKPTGSPDAVDSFHYNDEAGAKAMAEALGGSRLKSGGFEAAGDRLEVGLRPGNRSEGSLLEHYEAGARRIVVGSMGQSYSIYLKNRTRHAMEIVASVDGLDVMDGKAASIQKRGYILEPKAELSIAGFRVSKDQVRQFVFGTVDSSAAAKAGMARNAGVIGVAVYEEDEAQAKLARLVESQKRGAASAFPLNTR